MIKRLLSKIYILWVKRSSDSYCNYLRSKGLRIGENVKINPKHCIIDTTRPSLITIGDNVSMNTNIALITHDFVSGVFLNVYNDFIPSSGRITIGNNVRFGINCTVLKGVTIGDNCFIGAGSVVSSDIPSNSIASGNPAKVFCSLEDFYNYRKGVCLQEAAEYVRSIKERYNRDPKPEDFWEEFPFFVDNSNIDKYPNIPIRKQIGKAFPNWIKDHKALYTNFEEFITAALHSSTPSVQSSSEEMVRKAKKVIDIDTIRHIFSETFNCPSDIVERLQYRISNGWDSIGHMSLLANIEEKIGVSLNPKDMFAISSYNKCIEVLNKYVIINAKTNIKRPSGILFDFNDFKDNVALIDEHSVYKYCDIINRVEDCRPLLKKRKLAVLLAQNSVGSVVSYIICVKLNIPVMLIDGKKDQQTINRIITTFHPEYIFIKKDNNFNILGTVLNSVYDYEIIHYEKTSYQIYDDLSLMLPTSGSTGSPKFVRISKKNILSNTKSIIEYLSINERERAITSLPMYYSYGLSVINTHLQVGATLVVTDKSVTDIRFWDFAKKNSITSFSGVPYTYTILRKMNILELNIPTLSTFTQAGGKLDANDVKYYAERCHSLGKQFIVMYGQTEATARISYLPYEKSISKSNSIGISIPGGELSLAEDGELIYKGDNVSLGYAESYIDLERGDDFHGVLYTGDIAKKDEEGFYYIIGRKKRFLKIFGNRVGLDELENLISEKFGKVYCIGIDDHITILSTNKNLSGNDIIDYTSKKTNLNASAFKYIYCETIPCSDSGKVLYKEMEKLYL